MGVIADRPTHDVIDRAPSLGAVRCARRRRDATRRDALDGRIRIERARDATRRRRRDDARATTTDDDDGRRRRATTRAASHRRTDGRAASDARAASNFNATDCRDALLGASAGGGLGWIVGAQTRAKTCMRAPTAACMGALGLAFGGDARDAEQRGAVDGVSAERVDADATFVASAQRSERTNERRVEASTRAASKLIQRVSVTAGRRDVARARDARRAFKRREARASTSIISRVDARRSLGSAPGPRAERHADQHHERQHRRDREPRA